MIASRIQAISDTANKPKPPTKPNCNRMVTPVLSTGWIKFGRRRLSPIKSTLIESHSNRVDGIYPVYWRNAFTKYTKIPKSTKATMPELTNNTTNISILLFLIGLHRRKMEATMFCRENCSPEAITTNADIAIEVFLSMYIRL